ncbi:hypothetical protein DDB_G0267680 [Dictyostelium discoideum AX4]|uniref:Uncharacterized protein n=1 Tax=Dictyostelium discoideum TaxID=44689 RepID=Q55GG9_DICDI|nr:hypothetical protein DDB_G0267680 [Dictyostelium discoideum AX4]EAL73293.1 hypothetical protein DDB_G0267680 [Dictyostelium discoideum AX4]|eukprot:XP_647215.1 hypothetical protein DDB_G0267680 [Dictyostelium discoideum AX4]
MGIIDPNSSKLPAGPKYIQFGEIKDEYDKAKLLLTQDFPMCFSAISSLFECEKLNGYKPSTSKNDTTSKKCKNENAHLNFCILSSFCPSEAQLLMECTNGVIPTDDNKLPSKCQIYFNSFDNCLQRKTKEFELRDSKESDPVSQVIYGEQTTQTEGNNN